MTKVKQNVKKHFSILKFGYKDRSYNVLDDKLGAKPHQKSKS